MKIYINLGREVFILAELIKAFQSTSHSILIPAYLVPSSSCNAHPLLSPQNLIWEPDQHLFRATRTEDRLS
jgi:hypothetical protein